VAAMGQPQALRKRQWRCFATRRMPAVPRRSERMHVQVKSCGVPNGGPIGGPAPEGGLSPEGRDQRGRGGRGLLWEGGPPLGGREPVRLHGKPGVYVCVCVCVCVCPRAPSRVCVCLGELHGRAPRARCVAASRPTAAQARPRCRAVPPSPCLPQEWCAHQERGREQRVVQRLGQRPALGLQIRRDRHLGGGVGSEARAAGGEARGISRRRRASGGRLLRGVWPGVVLQGAQQPPGSRLQSTGRA
jgi:hypothetical protein